MPQSEASDLESLPSLEELAEQRRLFAIEWKRIGDRFNGRKAKRTVVDYQYDRKVTTCYYENGDQLSFIEPGVTFDNAWMFALARDQDFDIKYFQRNAEQFRFQALGPWPRWYYTNPDDLDEVGLHAFKIFGGVCAKCHRDACDYGFHIDHHLPKSMGHDLTKANAVLLCARCNRAKRAKLPAEFYTPEELEIVEGILRTHAA